MFASDNGGTIVCKLELLCLITEEVVQEDEEEQWQRQHTSLWNANVNLERRRLVSIQFDGSGYGF